MREIARLEPKDGIYTARAEVVNLLLRVGLSEKDVEKIIKTHIPLIETMLLWNY